MKMQISLPPIKSKIVQFLFLNLTDLETVSECERSWKLGDKKKKKIKS